MLLTIIIPAYNAEKYIDACLRSCYKYTAGEKGGNQLLSEEEMEVIVVDDGSDDSTPTLLQQWASKQKTLRILHQENQGQSVARNLAIEQAQGDYIYMVDADDEMMGVLPVELMRKRSHDIIAVQVMYRLENGKQRAWSHQMEHWPFGKEYQTGADFVRCHNIEGLVYGYLFSRKLFTSHPELRFTPGIYHQDEELIFKIFTLAGKTIYTQGYTYLYFEHNGSSLNTRTEARKRKLMDDYVVILRNLVAWRDQRHLGETMHYKLSYLSMDVLRMLIRFDHEQDYVAAVIEELRKLGLYPLPWVNDLRYLGMKMLTCHPALIRFWLKHRMIKF